MSDGRNFLNFPTHEYMTTWAPRKKHPTISRLPPVHQSTLNTPPPLPPRHNERSLIVSSDERRRRYQERRRQQRPDHGPQPQRHHRWTNSLVPSIEGALAEAAANENDDTLDNWSTDVGSSDDCSGMAVQGLDLLWFVCTSLEEQGQ